MDMLVAFRILLSDAGPVGRLALLALAWTIAASIAHLFSAGALYARFSREGPVPPALLPQLEVKWGRATTVLRIWVWLRRIGLFLLFATVLMALVALGLQLRSLLASGPDTSDWRLQLAGHLQQISSAVMVMVVGFLVRIVLGGFANIVAVRAQNFVTASNSLVSREEVDRMRAFLDRMERSGPPSEDNSAP
jgi:hypothetical protein